jgi:hypothetical protein
MFIMELGQNNRNDAFMMASYISELSVRSNPLITATYEGGETRPFTFDKSNFNNHYTTDPIKYEQTYILQNNN